jgi:hypothetical protein
MKKKNKEVTLTLIFSIFVCENGGLYLEFEISFEDEGE